MGERDKDLHDGLLDIIDYLEKYGEKRNRGKGRNGKEKKSCIFTN